MPVLSLAISIATIEVCTHLARQKIIGMADEEAEAHKNFAAYAVGQFINTTAWVDCAFASSFAEADSAYFFRFRESERGKLTTDEVYGRIQSHFGFFTGYHAVCAIFEKGVLADRMDRPFAGCVRGKAPDIRVDLLEEYDIFNHEQYRYGADSLVLHYFSPARYLTADSVSIVIHSIPMYDSADHCVGELWFDYDLVGAGDTLASYRQYANTALFLVNGDENTISASTLSNNVLGQPYMAVVDSLLGDVPPEAIDRLKEAIAGNKDASFSVKSSTARNRVYVSRIPGYSSSCVQIVSEDEMYESINRFKYVLLALSVLGILIVFLLSSIFFQKFYKSETENLSTRREMEIAAKLQDRLLPPQMPDVSGVEIDAVQRQALLVGGDLYDSRVRRGQLLICVGDVSGKGVPACMYMGMVSSHLRALFQTISDPAQILSEINNAICDRNPLMMFCTMILGVLDLTTGEMEFCNAGHGRPVLRTSGGWEFLEMKKNIPLGIEPDFKFVSEKLTLAPSDTLFVYTDGVTEARALSESLFGEPRLLALLQGLRATGAVAAVRQTPASINAAVLSSIEDFCTGAPQSDDITMLCLTFSGGRDA